MKLIILIFFVLVLFSSCNDRNTVMEITEGPKGFTVHYFYMDSLGVRIRMEEVFITIEGANKFVIFIENKESK